MPAELVVSFLDGAVRSVQRETHWWPFIHEGDAVEWCAASTQIEGARVAVVAVRLRGTESTIVGATIKYLTRAWPVRTIKLAPIGRCPSGRPLIPSRTRCSISGPKKSR